MYYQSNILSNDAHQKSSYLCLELFTTYFDILESPHIASLETFRNPKGLSCKEYIRLIIENPPSVLLNTFQILQITAIENEISDRTVPAPFVKFVGQPNTEISLQAMTAITRTHEIRN